MSEFAKSSIFYYEMLGFSSFKPAREIDGLGIEPILDPSGQLNAEFYRAVGKDYSWADRLGWTETDWSEYVNRDNLTTFVAVLDDQRIGYSEVEQQGHDVEIVYFGLLPPYLGKGLGGAFLSMVVAKAWLLPNAQRLWLHTCSEDHRHAAKNYEARGFQHYKTEIDQ